MKKILFWILLLASCYVSQAQGVSISAIEYFFDEDPGFGLGTPISVTESTEISLTETLTTSGLAPGFHNLYLRAQDDNGVWGPYDATLLYVNTNEVINDIVEINALEYFFDTDPGFGNGTPISVSTASTVSLVETLNTSGLSHGFHTLYLRGKRASGSWGPYETKVIYVNSEPVLDAVVEIESLEYFYDEDPGHGNGTPISVTLGEEVSLISQLSTDGLTTGFHDLYLRGKLKDGSWGAYESKVVYVNAAAVLDAVVEIESLEYFYDEDPGFGNGTPISVTLGEEVAITNELNTDGLSMGFHNLYLRGKLKDGSWGPYETKVVYISEPSVEPIEIVQVEYFIDEDPGLGMGQVIDFESTQELNDTIEVITSALAVGDHKVYMRAKSADGSWGHYETAEFLVIQSVLTEDFETGLPATNGTGDYTLASGTWSGTNVSEETTNINGGATATRLQMQNASLSTPEFYGVSDLSFYYALPAAGSQTFIISISEDGGAYEPFDTVTATADVYQLYDTALNAFGSWVNLRIQTDFTAGSTQDLLIDDFHAASISEEPSITVISPNGGENFVVGQEYEISWSIENITPTDLIEIRYTTGGGANSYIIADGTFSMFETNTYNWTVPFDYASDARIVVANTTLDISDASDETFQMVAASAITLLTPNGGNQLNPGESYNITWSGTSLASTDNMEISYSIDGGENYDVISTGLLSAYPGNTYSWEVPQVRSNTVKVKVSDLTAGISDESNTNLTIGDYTAPAFNTAPQVSIVGGKHSITVNLSEVATVYFMVQNDGFGYPSAQQAIDAVENDEPFTGQLIAGSFDLQNANAAVAIAGFAAYTPDARYDVFVTAVDAAGNINAGYGVPNVIAQFTPLQRDSMALMTIYNEMGGANWTLVNDWATSSLTDWAEVTIDEEQQRIVGLNLSGKGVEGSVPSNLTQLSALTSLDMSGNDITAVPTLTSLENLQSAKLANNKLTFASIVPNLSVSGFEFKPQKKFGETLYDTAYAGVNYSLVAPNMGSGVVYQWYFGPLVPGQRFNNNVSAITENGNTQNYQITDLNINNQGTYKLQVTHPSVEDFAIEGFNQNIYGKTDLNGTINVDGETLNAGEVFVYRQTPQGAFVQEDSTLVGADGTYEFVGVVLGNFVLQVKPDRTTNATALQTYYISAERYSQADTLVLDRERDNVDIDLLFYDPAPFDPQGAKISGFLESELPFGLIDPANRVTDRRKVRKAACSMRRFKSQGRPGQDDFETEIAYYIETDDEGYFNFEGVEPNRYLINIEFPGVPMDESSEVEFIISDEKENQVFEVNALVTELGIVIEQTEVLFNWKPYLKDVVIYPNPTEGQLGVDYTVYRTITDLKAIIYDNQGRVLSMQQVPHQKGIQHIEFDLTEEPSGIYHLVLSNKAGSFSQQLKISKK